MGGIGADEKEMADIRLSVAEINKDSRNQLVYHSQGTFHLIFPLSTRF